MTYSAFTAADCKKKKNCLSRLGVAFVLGKSGHVGKKQPLISFKSLQMTIEDFSFLG